MRDARGQRAERRQAIALDDVRVAIAHGLLEARALGDVERDADRAHAAAAGIAQRLDPAVPQALGRAPVEVGALARDGAPVRLEQRVARVVVREEAREREAHDALGIEAEHLETGADRRGDVQVAIRRPDDSGQLVGHEVEPQIGDLAEGRDVRARVGLRARRAARALARRGVAADAAHGGAQLELVHDDRREVREHLALGRREIARPVIDELEAADVVALGRADGGARVEAHARLARHERARREARVSRDVGDDEDVGARYGRVAERERARRGGQREAVARLRPGALAVDEDDGDGRHAEEPRRERRDAIELGLGRRVEDAVTTERRDSTLLVFRRYHAEPAGARETNPQSRAPICSNL